MVLAAHAGVWRGPVAGMQQVILTDGGRWSGWQFVPWNGGLQLHLAHRLLGQVSVPKEQVPTVFQASVWTSS